MTLSLFDRLTQQRLGKIYIFPTKAGWGFILLLLLLLVLSINFENNLAFALTFFLVGLFVVAILYTYSNLLGVHLVRATSQACFAGEQAGFSLMVSGTASGRREKEHQQLQVSWVGDLTSASMNSVVVDLVESSQVPVELSVPTKHRGWVEPPKVKIQTVFPLGLFRSWCYQQLSCKALVYPAPVASQHLPATAGSGGQGGLTTQSGSDDFSELKRFEAGMSPQHIAWKVYARGQGLHAKRFASRQDMDIWLDYDAWPDASQEMRLSRLCYWVLKFHREDRCYGVRLPGREWPPARGEHHRLQVLQALALFGKESSE